MNCANLTINSYYVHNLFINCCYDNNSSERNISKLFVMGSLHIEFFHNNSPGTERYPGTPHFMEDICLHEAIKVDTGME